jgi:hypothetical protein
VEHEPAPERTERQGSRSPELGEDVALRQRRAAAGHLLALCANVKPRNIAKERARGLELLPGRRLVSLRNHLVIVTKVERCVKLRIATMWEQRIQPLAREF